MQRINEIFYEPDSGNIYHILHGWIERNDKEYYFFSWMNKSTKGHSFIFSKDKDIENLTPIDISQLLEFDTSQIQSKELLLFIKNQFNAKRKSGISNGTNEKISNASKRRYGALW